MKPVLSDAGYRQTKLKLLDLVERRSRIVNRTDLSPTHRADVLRSYSQMIRQYRSELKLFDATHAAVATTEEVAKN